MRLKRRDVLSNLQRKGFISKERGRHVFLIYHNADGQKTEISTFVSRGTKYKDLGDDLVSSMAKQCKLTIGEFGELVDCSMSRDDYEGLVGPPD